MLELICFVFLRLISLSSYLTIPNAPFYTFAVVERSDEVLSADGSATEVTYSWIFLIITYMSFICPLSLPIDLFEPATWFWTVDTSFSTWSRWPCIALLIRFFIIAILPSHSCNFSYLNGFMVKMYLVLYPNCAVSLSNT